MNNFDIESEVYKFLGRCKQANTYQYLKLLVNNVLFIYSRRFGNRNYAVSISEQELTEQLIDCVNHFYMENNDIKMLFDNLSKSDSELLIAMILSIMLD